ncbi:MULTISPECIES: GlsB/YeaQ/YmgE family stress response membrane protein [unclassified Roseitalea]|uniref:GlsB/YeaQ/YmgE family stress response membrane protein n=1 Tax=unclassified Roseitalea TaxID=2639107 RepID=UPI00273DEE83|nr:MULTISPECIES: GlsB/YeaQ/YmgE family stress response membrane protein [unclassified Roseitalea]
MDIVGLIIMLAIGAIAGWLAGMIIKGGGYGLVGNIAVGIVGAVIAGFLFPGFLPLGGIVGQIISATIGAVILLAIIALVKRAT